VTEDHVVHSTQSRRVAIVALVTVLAAALIALLPMRANGGAGPIDCTLDPADPACAPTSTDDEPSTTADETTTTESSTTTSAAQTTTTEEQVTTTTEDATTLSTVNALLVPGDGSEGAESTTTTTVAVDDGDDSSEATVVWLIVAGLVAVAAAIGVLTWRYWLATKPAQPAA
jgi:cobalamin biosynthesis Mg chelatase CobN